MTNDVDKLALDLIDRTVEMEEAREKSRAAMKARVRAYDALLKAMDAGDEVTVGNVTITKRRLRGGFETLDVVDAAAVKKRPEFGDPDLMPKRRGRK